MPEKGLFLQNVIAVVWDFDKTLSPNYMQKPIFDAYDVDEDIFWREVNALPEYYKRAGIAVQGFQLRHYRASHTPAVEEEIVSSLAKGSWRLPISEIAGLEQVPDYHRRLAARQLRGRVLFELGGDI